jgi:hypothetical protein
MKAATEQQNAYLEKLSAKSGGKTKPKALKKKLDVLVKKKTALDSETPLLRCFAPLLCACLSVCLSVRPSVRLSVCLSVRMLVAGGRGSYISVVYFGSASQLTGAPALLSFDRGPRPVLGEGWRSVPAEVAGGAWQVEGAGLVVLERCSGWGTADLCALQACDVLLKHCLIVGLHKTARGFF